MKGRLRERMRELLAHRPDVTERKMFGGLAFLGVIQIVDIALKAISPDSAVRARRSRQVAVTICPTSISSNGPTGFKSS